MLFAEDGPVVVQEMLTGGYDVTVPSGKVDALSDRLDAEDIFYELDDGFANVDDTTDENSSAAIFTFGPDTDVARLQAILDDMD